jgi:hypothetical protein
MIKPSTGFGPGAIGRLFVILVVGVALGLGSRAASRVAWAAPAAQSGCRSDQVWNGSSCVCPPGQTDDGGTTTCHPIPRPPCPAGKIDIDGNNEDDGWPDCQPLVKVAAPSGCAPSGLDASGTVTCFLPGDQGSALGWGGRALRAAVGCLEISRSPFPRALANYPQDAGNVGGDPGTQFQLRWEGVPADGALGSWIVPPADLGLAPSQSGGYLPAGDATPAIGDRSDAVRGLSLGELSGGGFGGGFNTAQILASRGYAYPYPDIQNVKAYLAFKRVANPAATDWTIDNFPTPTRSPGGEVWFKFPRASFPAPQNGTITYNGLDKNLNPTLPAFRLRVKSEWELVYVAEWDVYGVSSDHRYVRVGRQSEVIRSLGTYSSYRVWGGGYLYPQNRAGYVRQPKSSAPFCQVWSSYVPVPVIEGQAVLTKSTTHPLEAGGL